MEVKGKYPVIDVAYYSINYLHKNNKTISNQKLQSLLYFIQGIYLYESDGEEACFDEEIQAWAYGPTVPYAYREFKQYGSFVPKISKIPVYDYSTSKYHLIDYTDSNIAPKDKELLESVLDKVMDYDGFYLSEVTKMQKPWEVAYAKGKDGVVITKKDMFKYFKDLNYKGLTDAPKANKDS